jgi:hypothetical protein
MILAHDDRAGQNCQALRLKTDRRSGAGQRGDPSLTKVPTFMPSSAQLRVPPRAEVTAAAPRLPSEMIFKGKERPEAGILT